MATLISDTPDGPIETELEQMSEEQLRSLMVAGSEEATRLWVARRGRVEPAPDWQQRMADRMGRARGQA